MSNENGSDSRKDQIGKRIRSQLDTPCVREFFDEYADNIVNRITENESIHAKKQIDHLEIENTQLKSQVEELRKKTDDCLNELQAVKSEYLLLSEKYGAIEKAYNFFQGLSSDEKKRLSGIFPTDSVYSVICAGTEWDRVQSMWNYARQMVVERKTEDNSGYSELFEFLFRVYETQVAECRYALIDPHPGDTYNMRFHSILGNKTDGVVQHVLLNGLIEIESNKVVNKAIIEV